MPACEQCGAPSAQTLKLERGPYTASQAVCAAYRCLFHAAKNCLLALDLTLPKNDLGSQGQNENAPPESGWRRKEHLRLMQ